MLGLVFGRSELRPIYCNKHPDLIQGMSTTQRLPGNGTLQNPAQQPTSAGFLFWRTVRWAGDVVHCRRIVYTSRIVFV